MCNKVKCFFKRCGGELRVKKGKYGEFKGCSCYPICRYTVK
ncbi:topoisomerase DNA-binding C4 zinc finger domain-containing protein [Neobacillus niacini]